eukprot:scaffold88130_cov15-Prasinocladus_malaysianus.AAC.3
MQSKRESHYERGGVRTRNSYDTGARDVRLAAGREQTVATTMFLISADETKLLTLILAAKYLKIIYEVEAPTPAAADVPQCSVKLSALLLRNNRFAREREARQKCSAGVAAADDVAATDKFRK